jgi:hypothetical protein
MKTVSEKPLQGIVKTVFEQLAHPEQRKKAALVNCWPQIAGNKVSKRTKPRFTKGNQVTVWVDDSTLAFELNQRYKWSILKRLKNEFGENEVEDVRFYVGEIR